MRRSRRVRVARGSIAAALAAAALAGALIAAAEWRVAALADRGALERGLDAHAERAERILARAGPGWDAEILRALPSSALNGPVFRFDDRLGEARSRALDAGADASAPAAPAELVWSAEFEPGEPQPFAWQGGGPAPTSTAGVVSIVAAPGDFLATPAELAIPKDDVGELRIRVRAARGTRLELGWHGDEAPDDPWRHRVSVDLVPDGEFHTYVVDARLALERGLREGERIRRLLLRPSNVAGDRVEIDFVRLRSQLAAYRDAPQGRTAFSIGGELRSALTLLPGRALRYRVRVPEDEPVLELGLAALRSASGIQCEVRLSDGEQETRLLAAPARAGAWQDHRVGLGRFAGREIEIELRALGSAGDVTFWSSPLVRGRRRAPLHVVLYLEDTVRADHLSLYGYARATTPEKERLAARAAVFELAVSQATRTRPSVPSLMTSLLPTATGVWDFSERLHESYLTLAEILRAQGFATASFIQNGNAGPVAGLHQGFSQLFDDAVTGGRPEDLLEGPLRRWLNAHADRNAFVYVHLIDPHGPYDPPPPHDAWAREAARSAETGRAPKRDPALDPLWLEAPTRALRTALYDGELRNDDEHFARFVEDLSARGLLARTLLVYTSDHGEYLGERGLWEHRPPGLRPVTHVPLLVLHPDGLGAGRRIAAPVQLLDVVPTILEAVGVDPRALPLQGDSLLPLLRGARGADASALDARVALSDEVTGRGSKDEPCYCGSLHLGGLHWIRSSRLRAPLGRDAIAWRLYGPGPELDDSERVRSADAALFTQRALSARLRRLHDANLAIWRRVTGGAREVVHTDPEVQQRLRALGYVE